MKTSSFARWSSLSLIVGYGLVLVLVTFPTTRKAFAS
jgi:hypothetical protein